MQNGTDEVAEVDHKKRFLKNRTRRNTDSRTAAAEIPEMFTSECLDNDNEAPVMIQPLFDVPREDLSRIQQELTHLPSETVFRLFSFYEYDVDATLEVGRQLSNIELMPEYIKDVFAANICVERDANPTRKLPYKEFYFAKLFEKAVDSKTLVDYYYSEKNKLGGNWRLEHDEPEMSSDRKEQLEELMRINNISIVQQDNSVLKKSTRFRKLIGMRRGNRLRRNGSSAVSAEGSQERDADSDSISVASSSGKSDSGISMNTSMDTSTQLPPINLKFRFTPSKSGLVTIATVTSPNSSIKVLPSPTVPEPATDKKDADVDMESSTKTKKWNRRTIEQQRGGAQKVYPGRQRRPRRIFEQ